MRTKMKEKKKNGRRLKMKLNMPFIERLLDQRTNLIIYWNLDAKR